MSACGAARLLVIVVITELSRYTQTVPHVIPVPSDRSAITAFCRFLPVISLNWDIPHPSFKTTAKTNNTQTTTVFAPTCYGY